MIKTIVILILITNFACSSPFSPSNYSDSDIVYVDVNNSSGQEDGSIFYPFTSISKAVSQAKEGARIIVRPGTYRETEIWMKKGQKLQGSGADHTIIEKMGDDLIILNSGCEVSGFYIKTQIRNIPSRSVLVAENCENIKIFNNEIHYAEGYSIFLSRSSGHIFNNRLNKISVDYCQDVVIENNEFEAIPFIWQGIDYGVAIAVIGSSPIIRKNHIFNYESGIVITMAMGGIISSPLISDNIIEKNREYGIRISNYPCEADIGGGKRGSPGNNIIRNNGKWDLLNDSPSEIYAKYNTWTHSTEEEIDRFDIADDDEGQGGMVFFVPFKALEARAQAPLRCFRTIFLIDMFFCPPINYSKNILLL